MGYVRAPGGSDAVHEDREVVGSTEPSDRRTRHARSTDPMAERYVVSHAEAAKVLRKAGYSQQRIQELLRDFPDPIDTERNSDEIVEPGYQCGSSWIGWAAAPESPGSPS